MEPYDKRDIRKNLYKGAGAVFCAMVLALIAASCNRAASEAESLSAVLDSIRQQYVPDARLAVFEITARAQRDVIRVEGEVSVPEAREAVESYLENLSSPVESGIRLLPDTSAGEKIFGLIGLSVANIRSEPGHRSEMVTQAIMGTPVMVLKVQDNWVLVQTPDRYLGWTNSGAVTRLTAEELEAWNASTRLIYTAHSGFIWDSLQASHPVTDITGGGMVRLVEESGDLFRVELPDGRNGAVRRTEAARFDSWMEGLDLSGKKIAETAMRFTGHPYLWGGTSTKGFDCSGYTKTVYFLNGIILPRDADQQSECGEHVPTENQFTLLQPGDLLFFGSPPSGGGKARITHTGIYAGSLQFIHSAGTPAMVRLNSLDPGAEDFSEDLLNALVEARRIIRDGVVLAVCPGDEEAAVVDPVLLTEPLQATLITGNEFYR